jgi:hypothetical protein
MPQLAGPPGPDNVHVPTVLPPASVHEPVQQSAAVAQESPGCPQKEEAWHVPLEAQNPEQHSDAPVHALPSVLQVALRGVQLPPPHVWLQHWPLEVQGWLSETHDG